VTERANYPTKVAAVWVGGAYWLDTEPYKHPDALVLEFPYQFIERYKAKRDEWLSVQNEIEKAYIAVRYPEGA